MAPPFVFDSASDKLVETTTPPVLPHGLAPRYRPAGDGPNVLSPDDPQWALLDDLRQQAWDRGIQPGAFIFMESGCCPQQIGDQICMLRAWLA